jgi:hypothetical protein
LPRKPVVLVRMCALSKVVSTYLDRPHVCDARLVG